MSEQELLERGKALRRRGDTWNSAARKLGKSYDWLRIRLDPEWAKRRRAKQAKERKERAGICPREHIGYATARPPISAAEYKAMRNRLPPDTRDLTARLFGDPRPGRELMRGGQ